MLSQKCLFQYRQAIVRKFHGAGLTVAIAILVFLFNGCASVPLPPAQPASDIKAISGIWQGSFYSLNNKLVDSTLSIKEDGSYEDYIPDLPTQFWTGRIEIIDGKYRSKSETSGRMYTITLHEQDGKRFLVKAPDNKTYSIVKYSPAK